MTVELKILMSWKDRRISEQKQRHISHPENLSNFRISTPTGLNPALTTSPAFLNASTDGFELEQLVLESGGEREAVWSPNFSIAHLIEFTKLQTLR